jgi:hydroxymethylpyrimidine pyrophosphatase-like HAD family hydrolase
MSALGVTKGTSLATHAIALGYPAAQVAAVGDMPNDVPMIEWAGVGLGVTGAHPRVLAAADAVLPAPEHDGVARFVEAALEAR